MATNSPEVARLVRRLDQLSRLIDDPAATDGERENAMLRYGETRNALRRLGA